MHAVVRECCQAMAGAAEAAPVPLSINCMALASPQAVFARLLDGVNAAAQLPLKPATNSADPFIQPGTPQTPLLPSKDRTYTCCMPCPQVPAVLPHIPSRSLAKTLLDLVKDAFGSFRMIYMPDDWRENLQARTNPRPPDRPIHMSP